MLRLIITLLASALILGNTTANAHKATERYIPIGYSYDKSQHDTYIGIITSYDTSKMIITVSGREGEKNVQLYSDTKIWLDRSKAKKPTLDGRDSDLMKDLRVEVKFLDPEKKQKAEWIKIEISE